MTSVSKNMYIDKLDDINTTKLIVNKYNNKVQQCKAKHVY